MVVGGATGALGVGVSVGDAANVADGTNVVAEEAEVVRVRTKEELDSVEETGTGAQTPEAVLQ
jgi:hypothetical protein